MSWQPSGYAGVLFGTAILAFTVAIVVWQRPNTPGARVLAGLLTAVAGWAVLSALETMAVPLQAKIFWAKLGYLGSASVPPLWLVFVIQYTQQNRDLWRRRLFGLAVVPSVTLALVATNEWHRLIWSNITLTVGPLGVMAVYGHGPWFWAFIAYSYLLLVFGALFLVRMVRATTYLYRMQTIALLIAASCPWLANLAYVAGLVPVAGLDITPPAFALSGMVATWSILRFQFLDIVPAARDALFESMSAGMIVLDTDDRIVDANAAAEHYLGWPGKLIGQPAAFALAQLPELLAHSRDRSEGRAEVHLNTDPPRYFDLRISPLHDGRGHLRGRSIVFSDITVEWEVQSELEQAKAALQLANQELAWRLAELDTANSELQARNADLESFAHTVAHDLKTPLSQMLAYVEILSEDPTMLGPGGMPEGLDAVTRLGWQMSSIIHELLLLAEVRQAEVSLTRLDMPGTARQAVEHLQDLIEKRCAAVRLVSAEDWPPVTGYAPWVEEIWINYLTNALKYGGRENPASLVPPEVELGADELGDGHVRFWVRDNGCGLTEAEQLRLFVPFERLGKVRVTGHGLGLSIVRRIAEKLNGQVGVESSPGHGSKFWFTLPRWQGEERETVPPPA
jgi:PAS domain S-box-containing protein